MLLVGAVILYTVYVHMYVYIGICTYIYVYVQYITSPYSGLGISAGVIQ